MADPITEINTATNIHFMPVVTNQIFRESPVLYRIFRMGKEGDFGLALPSFDGRSIAEPLEIGEVGQESATYSTGTAQATGASTAVVGTSTVWTSAMANRAYIVITGAQTGQKGDGLAYGIASVTDNTHLVLSSAYEGTTTTTQEYVLTYFADTALAQGAYAKDTTWAAGSGDVLGAAEFAWKMYHNTLKIHNLDSTINAGRERLFDIVAMKMRNATRRLRKDLITDFFGSNADGANNMIGMQAMCALTGLVGGIQKRQYPWWQGYMKTVSAAMSWDVLNVAWYAAKKYGNGDAPTLIVTTDGVLNKYESDLSKVVVTGGSGTGYPNINLVQNMADKRKEIDGGFMAFKFKNIDIVADPNCPAGKAFVISEPYVHWRVLKNFASTGWEQLRSQGKDWAQMTIFGYGALTNSCCSKFGLLSSLTEL